MTAEDSGRVSRIPPPMKTFEVMHCGRLVVAFHTAREVLPEDFQAFIDAINQCLKQHKRARVMVFPGVGGPSAGQRQAMAKALKGMPYKIAVMTSSTFVRGICQVLSWLGVEVRAFPVGTEKEGLAYLELDEKDMDELVPALRRAYRDYPALRVPSLRNLVEGIH